MILCIKFVNYWGYTEMHSQQNINKCKEQVRVIINVIF